MLSVARIFLLRNFHTQTQSLWVFFQTINAFVFISRFWYDFFPLEKQIWISLKLKIKRRSVSLVHSTDHSCFLNVTIVLALLAWCKTTSWNTCFSYAQIWYSRDSQLKSLLLFHSWVLLYWQQPHSTVTCNLRLNESWQYGDKIHQYYLSWSTCSAAKATA